MMSRATQSVYWPGMKTDIERKRENCQSCHSEAPSQPSAPPTPLPVPQFPFQMISSDFFDYNGKNYLIIVDRYSNWISIYLAGKEGAKSLVQELKRHFSTFGISEELACDGGSVYTSTVTQEFLKRWNVKMRLSSAYFPHSNQRAEVAVKSAKRMLRENISGSGNLDTEKFLMALLTYRNTPDRDTGLSPAQVIFGHQIRDFLPVKPGSYSPRPEWQLTSHQREAAMAKKHLRRAEQLSEHTKQLKPLTVGDTVMVQNQHGPRANKWDKTGIVIEAKEHDQYLIRMDGSGRPTLRNRKFLRKVIPYSLADKDLEGQDMNIETDEPRKPERIRRKPKLHDLYHFLGEGKIDGSHCASK